MAIGFAGGGVNLYAYVWNNPLNKVDALGLRPDDPIFVDEMAALKDAFEYACKCGTEVEHGGRIYYVPNGKYAYTFASGPRTSDIQGAIGHVNPPYPSHSSRGVSTSVFHSHRQRGKFNVDKSDIEGGKKNYLFLPDCKGIVRYDFDLETEMPVYPK